MKNKAISIVSYLLAGIVTLSLHIFLYGEGVRNYEAALKQVYGHKVSRSDAAIRGIIRKVQQGSIRDEQVQLIMARHGFSTEWHLQPNCADFVLSNFRQ